MSIKIRIENIEAWFDALAAHEGPGEETEAALDASLHSGFLETQARVHVITGSLKASGRETSEVHGDEWRGEISYGGPAPGMANDPVRYASHEFGKGEDHNAMANLHLLAFDMEQALYATVRARGVAE